MKPLEECLKHTNSLNYPCHVTEIILRRNSPCLKTTDLSGFRFMSHPQLYNSNMRFRRNPDIPFWNGDFFLYLTDSEKEPFAGCSVKILRDCFFVNSIQGIKGRKTERGKLKGRFYNLIRYGNWEMALLDVVETNARWAEASRVKVVSSSCFRSDKRMVLRYDVPCMYRSYMLEGDFWVKEI